MQAIVLNLDHKKGKAQNYSAAQVIFYFKRKKKIFEKNGNQVRTELKTPAAKQTLKHHF